MCFHRLGMAYLYHNRQTNSAGKRDLSIAKKCKIYSNSSFLKIIFSCVLSSGREQYSTAKLLIFFSISSFVRRSVTESLRIGK